MLRSLIIGLYSFLAGFYCLSQSIYIKDYTLVVSDSSGIYIPGKLEVSSNDSNAYIDLDGIILLKGDLANKTEGSLFSSIEPSPDGILNLCGGTLQTIYGDSPIVYENLYLEDYRKILSNDNGVVKGILFQDAELDLNGNCLVIDNPSVSALIHKSRFIKSESLPVDGLGSIRWIIGDSVGDYLIPFGSGADTIDDLQLSVKIQTPGQPVNGNILFATYPTNIYNNPLPDGVSLFPPADNTLTADRYWLIKPDFELKPDVELTFTYTDNDITPDANPGIDEDSLQPLRFNDLQQQWDDWKPARLASPDLNKVTALGISGNNFYSDWVIMQNESELYYFVPNAFSPNGDGINDVFFPSFDFQPSSYELYIFDRWKSEIFYSNDINKPWDGSNYHHVLQRPAVYTWIIKLADAYGNNYLLKGYVTLIK